MAAGAEVAAFNFGSAGGQAAVEEKAAVEKKAAVGEKTVVDEDGGRGVQCSGRALHARQGKEGGQQLGRAEAHRLALGLVYRQPMVRLSPDYKTLKLAAEFYAMVADVELKGAVYAGTADSAQSALLTVLESLNDNWIPSTAHTALVAGALGGGLALGAEAAGRLSAALARLPAMPVRAKMEAAMKKKRLLSLAQLSETMYVLGKGVDVSAAILHAALEQLSQAPSRVVVEEDVDHYYRTIRALSQPGDATLNVLVFCPPLAAEHAVLEGGAVQLRRFTPGLTLPVLAPEWATLKVIAILFDCLYHMDNVAVRMVGPPGLLHQLGTLGGINRTFMNKWQKRHVLNSKNESLDNADLDALKEISVNAKHASINPKRHVAKGAKRVQRTILENSILNLEELVEVFTELAQRLFVPAELYRSLVYDMAAKGMLTTADADEITGKLGDEEKKHGVHFFRVAPLFSVKVELRLEGMVPRGTASQMAAESVSEAGETTESGDGETSQMDGVTVMLGPAATEKAAVICGLLHEFAAVKREGERATRRVRDTTNYARAAAFLAQPAAANDSADAATAKAYLKSAIDRHRNMPIPEVSFVLGILGRDKVVCGDSLQPLLAQLRKEGYLDDAQVLLARNSAPNPASANVLLTLFEKLNIVPK